MLYLVLPLLLIAAIAAGGGFAYAQALTSPDTDEMALSPPLGARYQDAQLYWRELEQARDWDSLKAQLRNWHHAANPGWDEAQIEEVTRALNQAVFRFAEPIQS